MSDKEGEMRNLIVGLLLIGLGCMPAANAAKPGGGGTITAGVAGQNLGVLPGDKYSDAWDVNAQGHAVGRSYNSGSRTTAQLIKAFYWNGTMHRLLPATQAPAGQTPWGSEARAISGAATETAVGLEDRTICTPDPTDPTTKICDYEQYPIIWINAGTSTAAVRLGSMPGSAFGINDAGTSAVGVSGEGVGAIWSSASGWSADPTQIYVPSSVNKADDLVPFPDGHTPESSDLRYEGVAWDVNDDGIVVGTLTTIDKVAEAACLATDVRPCVPDVSYSRSYIYIPSSETFLVLPTPGDYKETSAYAVSNATDGKVYVAGWTGWRTEDRLTELSKGIRWTVNASNGISTDEDVLVEQAWAEGVTQDGLVAGTRNSERSRRGSITQTATLWSEPVGYILLKPPGGSDSTSRAMAGRCLGSSGPIYVVGAANVSGAWTAARWSIQCSTASP